MPSKGRQSPGDARLEGRRRTVCQGPPAADDGPARAEPGRPTGPGSIDPREGKETGYAREVAALSGTPESGRMGRAAGPRRSGTRARNRAALRARARAESDGRTRHSHAST